MGTVESFPGTREKLDLNGEKMKAKQIMLRSQAGRYTIAKFIPDTPTHILNEMGRRLADGIDEITREEFRQINDSFQPVKGEPDERLAVLNKLFPGSKASKTPRDAKVREIFQWLRGDEGRKGMKPPLSLLWTEYVLTGKKGRKNTLASKTQDDTKWKIHHKMQVSRNELYTMAHNAPIGGIKNGEPVILDQERYDYIMNLVYHLDDLINTDRIRRNTYAVRHGIPIEDDARAIDGIAKSHGPKYPNQTMRQFGRTGRMLGAVLLTGMGGLYLLAKKGELSLPAVAALGTAYVLARPGTFAKPLQRRLRQLQFTRGTDFSRLVGILQGEAGADLAGRLSSKATGKLFYKEMKDKTLFIPPNPDDPNAPENKKSKGQITLKRFEEIKKQLAPSDSSDVDIRFRDLSFEDVAILIDKMQEARRKGREVLADVQDMFRLGAAYA